MAKIPGALTKEQMVVAAAQLAAATIERDGSIAEHLALLEGVKDSYELGALHFYRYLEALERLSDPQLRSGNLH